MRWPQSLGIKQLDREYLLGSGTFLLMTINGFLLSIREFLNTLAGAPKVPVLRGSVHKQLASEKFLGVLNLRHLEYLLLLKILLGEILDRGVLI